MFNLKYSDWVFMPFHVSSYKCRTNFKKFSLTLHKARHLLHHKNVLIITSLLTHSSRTRGRPQVPPRQHEQRRGAGPHAALPEGGGAEVPGGLASRAGPRGAGGPPDLEEAQRGAAQPAAPGLQQPAHPGMKRLRYLGLMGIVKLISFV